MWQARMRIEKKHRLVARLGEAEALLDEAGEGRARLLRGSRSGIDDFSAAECVRSWRIDAPSP